MSGYRHTNQYKAAVADFFNARTEYKYSELHARIAARLLQYAAPQPGEKLLDIATGTGFIALAAAEQIGEQGEVIGVDISAGMLKQATQASHNMGIKNIRFQLVDAETLDFPSNSFDLITCCNALPYMTDVSECLRDWHALLRPAGRLVFNCWSEDSHATGHQLRRFAASYGIRIAVIGEETGTPERCQTLLSEAGYSSVKVNVEKTRSLWSAAQLENVFNSALINPLFGLSDEDSNKLRGLRAPYLHAAHTPEVYSSIEKEMGAFFVIAFK